MFNNIIKQEKSFKVKNNQDEHIDFKKFAPELSKIKKDNPFKVPDDYFDKLPEAIREKVASVTKKISIFEQFLLRFKQPKYSITTGLAFILIVVALFVFIKPADKEIQFLSDITIDDILEESPELIYDMDESIILEVLFADNTDETYDYFESDIYNDTTINEDEIIDYLSDENFETELLYNL